MAGGIKGITIKIGGDTTGLNKALSNTNKKTRDIQNELKKVNKALKLDPTNTELLAQKQDLLTQAIANTKQKLDALKQAQDKVNKAHEANPEWEKQYEPLKKQIDETADKMKKLAKKEQEMKDQLESGEIDAEQYEEYRSELDKVTQEHKNLMKSRRELEDKFKNGHISDVEYRDYQRTLVETQEELKRLEAQASTTNAVLAKIDKAGAKVESVGNGIANVGKKVSVASAAVTATGVATVKTASDFESSMSQVQATMGITKDTMSEVNGESVNTMDTLSDLAKQMGSETAFSASECAEALNYLALAGYDTQEMVDTLPTVLNLAAAGNIDLASASDMVTDAMSALGMETSDADTMVDQMAKTASSTNTSVAQLGEGILTIGATAKSIKGGTAELNAALGILANNGIKGAEGGTHLRNVILSLQSPTDAAASLMEELGVQTYDSEGNMRSLNDILGDLNTSLDGMTSAEKDNIIGTIFNKTDLSSVNALLANTGDAWNDLQSSIADSAGAAQQMADTQLDNLSGQLTILKSALEGLAISIGEALMPMIKNIVAKLQGFVTWLNNLDDGAKQVIVKIGLFVAALGPALVILGSVISKVGVAMQVFSKFGLKITSLVSSAGGLSGVMGKIGAAIMGVNPIVLGVVAVIALLVAAFKHLWDTNEGFRDAIIGIWNKIKDTASEFCQGIVDRLNALGFEFESITDVLKAVWDGFCNLLAPVFEGVFNHIANIFSEVTGIITGILDIFIGLFTGNWSQVWDGIKGIFLSVWNFIVSSFSNCLDMIKGVADAVLGWFGTSWSEVWTNIKTVFVNAWNGIVSFFTGAWNGIVTFFTTTIPAFFTETIPAFIDSVVDWFSTLPERIGYAIGALLANIVNFGVSVWNWVTVDLPLIIQGIIDWFATLPSRIWGWLVNTINNIAQWGANAYNTATQWVSNTINSIIDWFATLPSRIWEWLTQTISNIAQWGADMVSKGRQAASDLVTTVKTKISELPGEMLSIGSNIVHGIWDGITGAADWLHGKVSGFVTGIIDGFKENLGIHSPSKVMADKIGKFMPAGIATGFEDAIPNMMQKLRSNVSDITTGVQDMLNGKLQLGVNMANPPLQFAGMPSQTATRQTLTRADIEGAIASSGINAGGTLHATIVMPDGRVLAEATAPYNNIELNKMLEAGRRYR